MGNSLRCCISCILPCGALDVVRIVHSNGHVQEVSGDICAGDVMKANPKHVLRKHCPEGVRIIVLPPDAQLKRGDIYFLSPVSTSSAAAAADKAFAKGMTSNKKKKKNDFQDDRSSADLKSAVHNSKAASRDRCLTGILSEKKCSFSSRRSSRGRVGIWRPHLESISEDF